MKKNKPGSRITPAFFGRSLTADQYIEHWKARKVWTHLNYPKHKKRLNWCADQCEGAYLADVGCAFGHSTSMMKARHPGAWTGIDFSAEAVATASWMFPNIDFLYLPEPRDLFMAGPFDTIVSSEVVEHIQDDRDFLKALYEAAGLRVVLTTPCIDAQDPGHVRIYDDKSMGALLEGYEATWDKDEAFYYAVIKVRHEA